MSWIKPGLGHSIYALLRSDVHKKSPEALESVRQAMLSALGSKGAELNPRLKNRLLYLHDVHGLWYARSEMVAVLSHLHGEAHAVEAVHKLSPLFQGLLPKSMLDACRVRR